MLLYTSGKQALCYTDGKDYDGSFKINMLEFRKHPLQRQDYPSGSEGTKKEQEEATRYLLQQMQEQLEAHTGISGRKKVDFEYTFAFASMENSDEASLRIKAGRDGKLYQVKRMEQDIRDFLEERPIAFGKNFNFDPAEHYVAAKDREMLALLLELNNYRFNSFSYYSYRNGNRSELEIPPIFLKTCLKRLLQMDSFEVKEAQKGISIFHSRDRQPVLYEEGEELLPIPMRLEKIGDSFQLTATEEAVRFNYHYYPDAKVVIKDDLLFFLSDEEARILDAISLTLLQSNEKRLPVPRHLMREYLTESLPILEQHFPIEVEKDIQAEFQKHDLLCRIYLDWQAGELSVEVQFQYGDIQYNPMAVNHGLEEVPDTLLLDIQGETHILNLLLNQDYDYSIQEKGISLGDMDEVYDFLMVTIPELNEVAEIYSTPAVDSMLYQPSRNPQLVMDMNRNANLLEVTFSAEGISEEELRKVMKDLMRKKKYHRLSDGRLVDLQERAFQDYRQTLEQWEIAPRDAGSSMELPLHKLLAMDESILAYAELKNPVREFLNRLERVTERDFPLPAALQAQLRPYQEEGYNWLRMLDEYSFGGVLADDMGLGKTVQALAFAAALLEEKEAPILIICPSSVLYNWQRESARFLPGIATAMIDGTKPEREQKLAQAREDGVKLWFTSYPLLMRDLDLYGDTFFRTVILDEAQIVKNNTAKTTRAVQKLKARTKFALSGTPLENQLGELYSIYALVVPGLFSNQRIFKQLDAAQVSRKIRPFLLRRLKKDVLKELPDKVETIEYIELSEEQKKIYLSQLQMIKAETNEYLQEGSLDQNRIKILAGLTRLRQICCDPRLVSNNYTGESAKLERLMEYLQAAQENGNRVVLFSQFTQMLALIRERLDAQGRDYFYLDGQTAKEDRFKWTTQYNDGEKDLFLVSLRAGGTGLNLTGGDTVILYDSWWNPAVESQATDRVHRFGQKKTVQVLRMITAGTIEERINELQEQKRELIDQVITEGKQNLTSLSKEELLSILGD